MSTSERWKKLTDLTGFKLQISGVKAHSSLEIEEWLQNLLQRICQKGLCHNNAQPKIASNIPAKVMKDTTCESDFFFLDYCLGQIPSFQP